MEQRQVYYDSDLHVEAYHLAGIVRSFPNHFHPYYVVGFVEDGRRHLWCGGREYDCGPGDLILFRPEESHHCAPVDGEPLDYRAVNVPPETMLRVAKEVTGRDHPPRFRQPLISGSDLTGPLGDLFTAIVERAPLLEREEAFYLLLEQVLREHCVNGGPPIQGGDQRVAAARAYLREHLVENVSLGDLTALTGLSRSYLLELFTKETGVSPYRYLQSLRVQRAKGLLETGTPPAEAAMGAGFADQSHFTRFFKDFIGLTPRQYQRIFEQKEQ